MLVLNSDTVPASRFDQTDGAVWTTTRDRAVGPMLLNPDGSFPAGFSDFPTLLSETLCVTGIGARVWFKNYPNYSPERKVVLRRRVDCIAGACMLIRRRVIDDIGAFDESFFAISEEVDWCFFASAVRVGTSSTCRMPSSCTTVGRARGRYANRWPLYRHKVRAFSGALWTRRITDTRDGVCGGHPPPTGGVPVEWRGANPALAWSELMNQRFS